MTILSLGCQETSSFSISLVPYWAPGGTERGSEGQSTKKLARRRYRGDGRAFFKSVRIDILFGRLTWNPFSNEQNDSRASNLGPVQKRCQKSRGLPRANAYLPRANASPSSSSSSPSSFTSSSPFSSSSSSASSLSLRLPRDVPNQPIWFHFRSF